MLKVTSPFDDHIIAEIPLQDKHEVIKSLEIAHGLFVDQSKWLAAHKRISILERTASLMSEQIEELTEIATLEGGKPYMDSKIEVHRAINGVKLATQHIGQLKGTEVPMGLTKSSENRIAFSYREPIGVVYSISAFNHPLNLVIHQTVTAIAAGCPVIIKPASSTPLSCLNFANILTKAGLPQGWCQVIICKNEVAESLVYDSRVNYLSFIGSAKVGWYLRSKLSPGTRCALEHGGSAPVIVHHDADFDEMLPALLKGGFYHAGQVCVSVQRIYIHDSIAKKVAKKLSIMANALIVGDPMIKTTEVGPLISSDELDRVEAWVNEAIDEGAEVLCGAERLQNNCYKPTILYNPSHQSKVSREEVFGPVVCVYPFSEVDTAIELANSLDVHFQAAVFSKSIDLAMSSVKKLNASAVMVNDHTAFRVDWMPFGGRDSSGIGVGGIQFSMYEMTREKLMVIKSDVL